MPGNAPAAPVEPPPGGADAGTCSPGSAAPGRGATASWAAMGVPVEPEDEGASTEGRLGAASPPEGSPFELPGSADQPGPGDAPRASAPGRPARASAEPSADRPPARLAGPASPAAPEAGREAAGDGPRPEASPAAGTPDHATAPANVGHAVVGGEESADTAGSAAGREAPSAGGSSGGQEVGAEAHWGERSAAAGDGGHAGVAGGASVPGAGGQVGGSGRAVAPEVDGSGLPSEGTEGMDRAGAAIPAEVALTAAGPPGAPGTASVELGPGAAGSVPKGSPARVGRYPVEAVGDREWRSSSDGGVAAPPRAGAN